MKISVQMYSLRHEIEKEGVDAVLKGLRECGADGIEAIENAYGLTPEEYRAALDKNNLTAFGCHCGMSALADRTMAWSKALGFKQLIIPGLSTETLKNDVKATAATLLADAEFYIKHGIIIGYHNHSHEFEGGADYIAELLKAAPLLKFEPDIFWLAAAGKSATEYLKPYESRLATIHLKELNKDGADAPNPCFGKGVSEIKQCVRLAKKLNLPHIVIEFENLNVPWRSYVKQAVNYIREEL